MCLLSVLLMNFMFGRWELMGTQESAELCCRNHNQLILTMYSIIHGWHHPLVLNSAACWAHVGWKGGVQSWSKSCNAQTQLWKSNQQKFRKSLTKTKHKDFGGLNHSSSYNFTQTEHLLKWFWKHKQQRLSEDVQFNDSEWMRWRCWLTSAACVRSKWLRPHL